MKKFRRLVERLQNRRGFRILYSTAYPVLRRMGLIDFLKKHEKGGGGDPWAHKKDAKKYQDLFQKYSVDPKQLVRPSRDYLFGFLLCPNKEDLENIQGSSAALGTRFQIYDIRSPSLFKELRGSACDGLFIRPAHDNNVLRNLFHEAARVLSSESRIRLYPSIRELSIYEAKRTLANFLEINGIPHPPTRVFYDFRSAAEFFQSASFPLIFKTHVGSSANGVEILRSRRQALRLARQLFLRYYLRRAEIDRRSREWGYMIIQEYLESVKEFRIIKIGDSWFGHQKWKTAGQVFLSGSGSTRLIDPPKDLLDFCYDIAERFRFTSMDFDVFQDERGDFLINELQTWFGSYNPSQMYIDDVPGRYRKLEGKWVFEPGLYNTYGSFLLRLVHFVQILEQG